MSGTDKNNANPSAYSRAPNSEQWCAENREPSEPTSHTVPSMGESISSRTSTISFLMSQTIPQPRPVSNYIFEKKLRAIRGPALRGEGLT